MFAEIPMLALITAWAAAGLVAAYLAWSAVSDTRARLAYDSIAGVLGAMLGGMVAKVLVKDGTVALGSVAAAFLGAWGLVMVARAASIQRRV